MTIFGQQQQTGLIDRVTGGVGSLVTAPFNWVGDAAGGLIGGVGGGVVDAISTPFLIMGGMVLAAIVLIMVM